MMNVESLVLFINGKALEAKLTYFTWAADEEGYVAGILRYEPTVVKNRPVIGDTGVFTLKTDSGAVVFAAANVEIGSELGTLNLLEGFIEIECRWHGTLL